jgi:S1-C subfamily serine protease
VPLPMKTVWGLDVQSARLRWAVAAALTAFCSLVFGLGAMSPGHAQNPQGQVFRGLVENAGIWLELASDGSGRYELAVLDGLPSGAPQTLFLSLAPDSSAGGCRLRSSGGEAIVSVCPGEAVFSSDVSLGGAQGRVNWQPVGWAGSFAWGRGGATGNARQACALEGVLRTQGLSGTAFGSAASAVASEARRLRAAPFDPAVLARLRTERLQAYAVIALNPAEAAEAQRLADAVAGRPVLGRAVSLADATREQIVFDERVVNSPARQRAREELREIDRALSDIYDTTTAASEQALIRRLADEHLPLALQELRNTLSRGQPGVITDLIALEGAIGELDSCVSAVLGADAGAQRAVRESLVQRAGDIVSAIEISVATAGSSDAARATLQEWEANAAVVTALRQSGQALVFDRARSQVVQMAQAEERARLDGERRAAQQAAADQIAPTTRNTGDLDPSRVNRSVVLVVSLVRIDGRDGIATGSGFLVAPEYVVTNVHVIEGTRGLAVIRNGGTASDMLEAEIVALHPLHDIAILRVRGLSGRVLQIAAQEPPQGARIWALGFPGLADAFQTQSEQTASLSNGIVSRVYTGHTIIGEGLGDTRLVQHTADISPGNSGGPLFDACHRVVGVNTQLSQENASAVFNAVSASVLPGLLRDVGASPQVASGGC